MEYPLVYLAKYKAVLEAKDKFLQLIYRMVTENLEVILKEKHKNNELEKFVFAYQA